MVGGDDARGRLVRRDLQLLPLVVHVVEDADERVDQLRVELRAAAAAQLGHALLAGERRPVDPARRHGVVGVDHAQEPARRSGMSSPARPSG